MSQPENSASAQAPPELAMSLIRRMAAVDASSPFSLGDYLQEHNIQDPSIGKGARTRMLNFAFESDWVTCAPTQGEIPGRDGQGRPINLADFSLTSKGYKAASDAETETMKENSYEKVMISHSVKDKDLATSLRDLIASAFGLEVEKILCTSAQGSKPTPGSNVEELLKSRVMHCDVLIGLVTKSSVESAYALFEMGARWVLERPFYPVVKGSFGNLPAPLKNTQGVLAEDSAEIETLLQTINDNLDEDLRTRNNYQSCLDDFVELAKSSPD